MRGPVQLLHCNQDTGPARLRVMRRMICLLVQNITESPTDARMRYERHADGFRGKT